MTARCACENNSIFFYHFPLHEDVCLKYTRILTQSHWPLNKFIDELDDVSLFVQTTQFQVRIISSFSVSNPYTTNFSILSIENNVIVLERSYCLTQIVWCLNYDVNSCELYSIYTNIIQSQSTEFVILILISRSSRLITDADSLQRLESTDWIPSLRR